MFAWRPTPQPVLGVTPDIHRASILIVPTAVAVLQAGLEQESRFLCTKGLSAAAAHHQSAALAVSVELSLCMHVQRHA